MMRMRGRHLLNWAVVICSLLLPLTAMAGTIMSQQGASHCGMVACRCDCCQPGRSSKCQMSHSACACPGLAFLTATPASPEVEAATPYQPVVASPAAKIFIFSIFHPPKNTLRFSV
jgi:hypothetical protein